MKYKNFLLIVISVLLLVSCGKTVPDSFAEPNLAKVVVNTVVPETLAPTEIIVPTATLAPTAIPEAQQKIRAIMEAYGHVDEKYLTPAYWDKMANDIQMYGPAKRVLALEFHGDYYNMYPGVYESTPESFMRQMTYLMENNYHFVTGPEEVGFLEGWLQLPARSVILTSDSGATSLHSFPRIIADFQLLETKYGYTPHMQSYIWTHAMTPEESAGCKDNICWLSYAQYLDTGYFTFGSHTETHRDFGKLSKTETIWEFKTNMAKIKDHLGLNVYAITWPYETCSEFVDVLKQMGFKYAYGGWSRTMLYNFTYAKDNMPFCLPRLFPENPNGLSGRPEGQTLEQMLQNAQLDLPLK